MIKSVSTATNTRCSPTYDLSASPQVKRNPFSLIRGAAAVILRQFDLASRKPRWLPATLDKKETDRQTDRREKEEEGRDKIGFLVTGAISQIASLFFVDCPRIEEGREEGCTKQDSPP